MEHKAIRLGHVRYALTELYTMAMMHIDGIPPIAPEEERKELDTYMKLCLAFLLQVELEAGIVTAPQEPEEDRWWAEGV